jgi:dsRNA-specific ribonuclease
MATMLVVEEEKQGNLEKQGNQGNLRNLRKEEDYKIYEKCIKNIYTYYNINQMTDSKEILRDDDIIKTDEGLIFNPYNPLNVKITLSEVQSILSKYGLPTNIDNIALYERAFVHRSYTKRPSFENIQQNITILERPPDCMPLSSKSNERLEFLGDGVLECVTKYLLYRRFPKADEGFMTEKKIAIVKNEAIGKIALEMGLHKWLIISKHAEEKKIRTNLKKLGCLFESFIGALFLDFNKTVVKDDENWFQNMFVTGPGFQMAQKFIENVFEKHIDWIALIQNDDNYKNILQVKIQKEFKVTPHYLEIEHDIDFGYKMGVYLCLGQHIYTVSHNDAINISSFKNFKAIQDYIAENGKVFIFMGEGQHKIKRKAEQIACNEAIKMIDISNEEN